MKCLGFGWFTCRNDSSISNTTIIFILILNSKFHKKALAVVDLASEEEIYRNEMKLKISNRFEELFSSGVNSGFFSYFIVVFQHALFPRWASKSTFWCWALHTLPCLPFDWLIAKATRLQLWHFLLTSLGGKHNIIFKLITIWFSFYYA